MPAEEAPQSSLILYQTEDGRTRIQCRFEDETIWLTQVLIAELYQKDVRTINEHLANIFEEGELDRKATIRKFRIVRREGSREVAREIEHYCAAFFAEPAVAQEATTIAAAIRVADRANASSGSVKRMGIAHYPSTRIVFYG